MRSAWRWHSRPGLKARAGPGRVCQRQAERIQALERSLRHAQQEAELLRRRLGEMAVEPHRRHPGAQPAAAPSQPSGPLARLDDRAVLCVGGRPSSLPVYRYIVERTGGRFLHHDGGAEDDAVRLDATLAAADLVICQTGCISHDAYWRVKEHCTRTGKRCVFVESPSTAGLKRALLTLVPVNVEVEAAPVEGR